MSDSALHATLSDIFRDIFMRDVELRADLTAKDVEGWDSFKQIEIILALEEHYAIKFHTKDLDALHNVGDLVAMVARKTAG